MVHCSCHDIRSIVHNSRSFMHFLSKYQKVKVFVFMMKQISWMLYKIHFQSEAMYFSQIFHKNQTIKLVRYLNIKYLIYLFSSKGNDQAQDSFKLHSSPSIIGWRDWLMSSSKISSNVVYSSSRFLIDTYLLIWLN